MEKLKDMNQPDPKSPPASGAPSHRPPPPSAQPAGGNHFWIWIVAALCLLMLIGFFIWRNHSHAQASAASGGGRGGRGAGGPAMVSTETAQKGDIGVYVTALGVVTPLNTVSVISRISGQIVSVKYQEGQMVKAGDPLIEIDPGPNEAALTQAEGQLARDNATLENAKIDQQRYAEAFSKNAIPKQQLDTQNATVDQDAGTVKVDQGVLDNAKVQLAYCHITSPISGRVGLRLVDEGNVVTANGTTPLVVVTELQPISVIFTIAEDDLPRVLEQLRAGKTLPVDAYDRAQLKKLASGTLLTLDNQIDPTTGTVKLKAIFTNDDESLFPNQFVNARLLVKTLTDTTLLTNTVIQRNADSAFVYLLNPDQTVKLQTITVGTTDGNVSAVEGIDAGTVVVADNFNKLTDGAKVIVRPADNAGGTNSVAGAHHRRNGTNGVAGGKYQSQGDGQAKSAESE